MTAASRKRSAALWLPACVALAAAALFLAACGSSESSESERASFPGVGSPVDSRYSGGPINSSSISRLEVAWSQPLSPPTLERAFSPPPVVSDGVVYIQDLLSNVRALDLRDGEELWIKRYEKEVDPGPNGLDVAGSHVYGVTPTSAFALDRKSGREIWSTTLTRGANEAINMAPGYHDGRVYVSTQPALGEDDDPSGGVGVLWALDARTGKKIWHFDTVPRDLWGDPEVNWGGGLWYAPVFDGKGSMYFAVASPGPFTGTPDEPWGSSRPGPNPYTDSVVKLDEKTGKMDWYYQVTPHDLYGWDLVGPPILLEVDGRELVIAAGHAGVAVAVDAETGELVWEQTLGRHTGNDEDGELAMEGEYSELGRDGPLYPGQQGGVTAPMSSDGSSVFVPVVNHRSVADEDEVRELSAFFDGEVVALDAESGDIEWEYEDPSRFWDPYGATSVVNDLVLATTHDGKMFAFKRGDGELVWTADLPTNSKTGLTVVGDTILGVAGLASYRDDDVPELVAYRLGG
jgi:alcohol dehydrogenase (cytochrome c)